MITIRSIKFAIEPEDIANTTSREALFDFITKLDEAVGSWDFTLKLVDHFKQLKKQYDDLQDEDDEDDFRDEEPTQNNYKQYHGDN